MIRAFIGRSACIVRRHPRGVAIFATAAAVLAAGWVIHIARAADPAQQPAPAAAPSTIAPATTAAATDVFAVPEGANAELLKFIDKIDQMQPTNARTQKDLDDFLIKSRTAMIQAADKVLANKPDPKTRLQAVRAKVEALAMLDQAAHDPKQTKQLQDYIDAISKDEQADVAKLGKLVGLMLRVRALSAETKVETAKKLWAEVKANLQAAPTDPEGISLAIMAGESLEHMPEPFMPVASQAYRDMAALLATNPDPQLQQFVKAMPGIARRLSLLGNPIDIKGTLLSGQPFDPATLKGKVVLVDFWATWCGPCRAELPNVKANYEKYHDKGFEVVGVSLDEDRTKLDAFLASDKLPWPILFNPDPAQEGWHAPLAEYYGVNGIPCVILTDRDGKVVSLNARGPELGKKLHELLDK